MKTRTQLLTSLLCFLPAIAFGATLKFGGPIGGDQEVPALTPEDSSAMGSAVLTLDTEDLTYDLVIHVSGFSGDLTGAHIHVQADEPPPPENGPVIINLLEDGKSFDMVGSVLTYSVEDQPFGAENLAALLGGKTYLNFHTVAFPGGEARGQLLSIEESSDSLVNFSTRGMVNPGNGKAGLLIGGLALKETKTILFRMVAESMTRFGVQTGLKDTSFEVFQLPYGDLQEAELIGGNDNWMEAGQRFKIAATGYAPAFENESALIMTLEPGVYTMNADSEQGAGIALVETYGVEMGSIADVVDRAANGELNQEFTILSIALAELPDLAALLAGPGPFTFFAPTDEAFLAAFPGDSLGDLVADTAALETALLQHIVSGSITSGMLSNGENPVTALDGSEYNVTVSGTGVTVANANVLETDLILSNGVIHVIDAVIQLP